ncbi:hypothetical protein QVD17_41414 [Tagetes erecta]|uniref:Uncharacterized protein n=1 Tax=Tagetes erecta TaxID=13708 RepID=A0AAD8NEP7_TARER|nr:hypothetical protein QVD17_41414 [Tagetes erecta]
MWKQSHCKKGSRPLDKDLSLLVEEVDFEDVDLDENIEEENLDWVDDRARETWVKYKECLVNKYGKEQCKHPKSVDKDLWIQASGGIKKGKVYGLSNVSDSYTHGRQNPEIERLNKVIDELVKEKDEEKERMDGVIEGLAAENETIRNRMENFERMLKVMAQGGQSSS